MKEQEEAIAELRAMLKPGDTVYTILRHVSRSGMMRAISPVVMQDGQPHEIDYLVGPAVGYKFNRDHAGLTIHGCGMDMGFELVYNLGRALWRDGFECIGESCPANDHFNGSRDYTPHQHKDGGYALRHKWL